VEFFNRHEPLSLSSSGSQLFWEWHSGVEYVSSGPLALENSPAGSGRWTKLELCCLIFFIVPT